MTTEALFENFPVPEDAPRQVGPFAAVALEDSLDKLLDYAIPSRVLPHLRIGQRVKVPLGRKNRPRYGYVISIHATSAWPKIKPLFNIDDERVLVSPRMMELARWMSRYYCSPLGTVIDSIIPSAVKRKVGLGYTHRVRLLKPRDEVQIILEKTKARKRRALLGRLLQLGPDESIDLVRLASQAGVKPPSVRRLAKAGLVTIAAEPDMPALTDDMVVNPAEEKSIALNAQQQAVVDELLPRARLGGFSVNLLHGVTGSGKTEVYLQVIREVVDRGKQAIVLVPEIALTPQTVRRFTARFPRVAVLHSGLTATQRHKYWQQIATGQTEVVVGARSAIFAPVPNLGIIVVDEEHEASYKQDSAPRYHARDVAVKRAQLEGIPILLGSATPSLEMYWRVGAGASFATEPGRAASAANSVSNANGLGPAGLGGESELQSPQSSSPYHLLSLPHRVRGLPLPHIELIDMKQESRMRRGVHLLSQRLEHLLGATVQSGHQAILLLNRRGYSNFVYCASCQEAVQCKYCDTTMTYHRSAAMHVNTARTDAGLHTGQLHCHYCLAVRPLPEKCETCGKKLSLFGLGTQRVEEELGRKFPDLKFARVDSDTMRNAKDYEALLGKFARRELQVMLGTQMIAKGLDYPNVTLVGVINADTALSLPDFRAAERTFQLITQVAGRAGRGDAPGRVIVQSFFPDDPTIRAALRQDFIGFAKSELPHRREVGLPPFARVVRVILRDANQEKLHKHAQELASKLAEAVAEQKGQVTMKGPMPCPIAKIAGLYRAHILLYSPRAEPLQQILASVRTAGDLARSERVAVDVDPVSLL